MRLLLVRHAETASNVAGLMDTGIPGPGLTPAGQRQADDLVSTVALEQIEAIYASNQIRTQLTATPLAANRGLSIVVADGLREISAGQMEMKGDDHSIGVYLAVMQSWVTGDLAVRMPGGEDGREFLERFDMAVGGIVDAGWGVAALFSHGGSMRTWASIRAQNLRPGLDLQRDLANTEIVALEGVPGSWFLKELS